MSTFGSLCPPCLVRRTTPWAPPRPQRQRRSPRTECVSPGEGSCPECSLGRRQHARGGIRSRRRSRLGPGCTPSARWRARRRGGGMLCTAVALRGAAPRGAVPVAGAGRGFVANGDLGLATRWAVSGNLTLLLAFKKVPRNPHYLISHRCDISWLIECHAHA